MPKLLPSSPVCWFDLEKNGMDAVRQYSRKFDDWDPPSFQLSEAQIREAIAKVPEQGIRDTDYCQGNVRTFAQAQMRTMLPLEVEIRPGVILGHKHIPVNSVGSYIPGGRYPMFGSAQMSIIPAKVAGVKTRCRLHAAGEGAGLLSGYHQCHEEGRRGCDLYSGRGSGAGADGLRHGRTASRWTCCAARATDSWPKPSGNSSGAAASICWRGRRKLW